MDVNLNTISLTDVFRGNDLSGYSLTEHYTVLEQYQPVSIARGHVEIVESEQRNTTVITQDKGLEGRIQTTTGNGKVQLSCQFSINKIVHSEKSYADLHLIFDDVIKYTTEQLVIKKM